MNPEDVLLYAWGCIGNHEENKKKMKEILKKMRMEGNRIPQGKAFRINQSNHSPGFPRTVLNELIITISSKNKKSIIYEFTTIYADEIIYFCKLSRVLQILNQILGVNHDILVYFLVFFYNL